jgi:predicted O-methyltransferase YrrM
MKSDKRKIADITKYTSKPSHIAQLLFRLVNYFKPKTILELGTSVGISAMYMASPNKKAQVITVEGDPNTAKIAKLNFDKLKIKNITLINKSFEAFFEQDFDKINKLDFVFIDGNHQYTSTINYFNQIKPKLHDKSIVIIDDIYWSKEMTQAWKELCNLPEVTVSADIFEMGILFFKPDQIKQHFILKI